MTPQPTPSWFLHLYSGGEEIKLQSIYFHWHACFPRWVLTAGGCYGTHPSTRLCLHCQQLCQWRAALNTRRRSIRREESRNIQRSWFTATLHPSDSATGTMKCHNVEIPCVIYEVASASFTRIWHLARLKRNPVAKAVLKTFTREGAKDKLQALKMHPALAAAICASNSINVTSSHPG